MWHFNKFQNQPQGEPREHHLGEALKGSSKSKLHLTLGKTHIKKVFFLVVGPLRGGRGVTPPDH